jgi:hypothetical protein
MSKLSFQFICGMSRGGTTWIGHCLNEHPDIAVFGESLYWGRNYIHPANGIDYTKVESERVLSLLSGGTAAFIGEAPGHLKRINIARWQGIQQIATADAKTPAELYENVCEWIANEEGVTHVIEKTPHHIDWIPRIKEQLPAAKFVMMIREPYGFMRSYKHQGDRKPEPARLRFERQYHPLGCALIWRRYIRSAMFAKKNYGDSVLWVEFDELRESSEAVWSNILAFFELPYVSLKMVKEQNSSFTVKSNSLDPIDVFWMNLIAGSDMRKAGYSSRRSGVALSSIFRSVGGLFSWSWIAFNHLRKTVSGGVLRYLKIKK